MAKNIVVCCDGTANEFAKDRTNIIKLYSTLVHDTGAQVAYYHPGIGTMEPFGALSPITRAFTRLLGMAFGYGLGVSQGELSRVTLVQEGGAVVVPWTRTRRAFSS
jgi:uncharacterized protein (DUF2235 family)